VLDGAALAGRSVLVVDDIVGSGLTIREAGDALRALGATPILSALVVNQANLGVSRPEDLIDHWACVVRGWVRFPWEAGRAADA